LRRSVSSSSERAALGRKGRVPSVRTPPRTLRGRTAPVAARTASAGPGIAANFWVLGLDICLALKGAPRGALANVTRQDPWHQPTDSPRPLGLHQRQRSWRSAHSPCHFWFRGSDQREAGGQWGAAPRPTNRHNKWYQPLRSSGAPGVHRRWRPGPCAHCTARSEICQLRAQGCRLRRCGLLGARACAPASGTPWGNSGGMAPTRWAGCGAAGPWAGGGELDTGSPAGSAENHRTHKKSARTGCKVGGLGDAGMHRPHDFARAGEIRGCHELVCAVSVCAVHVQGYLAHKKSYERGKRAPPP